MPVTVARRAVPQSFTKRVCLRILAIIAATFVAVALTWHEHPAIFDAAGRLWVVSDQIKSADAAAVFGGRIDTRPYAAAQLYRAGLVQQILISNPKTKNADADNPDRDELLKLGIPAAAIRIFGRAPKNTFEEANALADWAKKNHARRIIVPAELFTSRRFQWIVCREVSKAGAEVIIEAVAPPAYDLDDWWKQKYGITDFKRELIKYLYYRFVYWRS
jgi:uncharacterized SAM-binding protein YcdF (DUF218 family)